MTNQPTVFVLAGPNGAGKTTLARQVLPEFAGITQFVNADLIAQGLSPFAPDSVAITAGKLMLRRIDELMAARQDFGFESTLSGRSLALRLRRMKNQGYVVHLIYFWLENADLAVTRVEERVRQGGHRVEAKVVRRRYWLGLRNLFDTDLSLADRWGIYDNSGSSLRCVARREESGVVVCDPAGYERIRAMAQTGHEP